VNRSLEGAAALLMVTLVGAPALGQAPLVVGSVRDQRGVPIVGATVNGRTPGGVAGVATTDASGTFALHTAGLVAVVITCRYCR
jgi:hypothetical protein